MTQDEIIEMAKRVVGNYEHASYWPFFTEELQHFAKLVEERTAAKERADERDACAKLFDDRNTGTGFYEPHEPAEIIRARAQAERGEA